MKKWKLDLFVSAIQIRNTNNEGTYEDILKTYPKLTDEEKTEILGVLERVD